MTSVYIHAVCFDIQSVISLSIINVLVFFVFFKLNEVTGLLEISDEESDDGEVYPENLISCARILPYDGPYKR